MHTQHINNINPYMVASVTRNLFRSYLFKSVFAYHCVKTASSNKQTACNHHFHQNCHPQCVWSRDVTNQSFQVASPNNRTICVYLFTFIMRQVAGPNNRTTGISLFISQSFQMAGLNNQTACVFPFTFIVFRAVSPKQWTVRALPCFERSVLNNGQLELSFIFFQAASPNGPFEFVFYLVSSRQS